ncbi:MAG: hypothetical protein OXI55_14585 [Gammaproteobacteria bacterium]|nr:hypothetical protein [Gammaproteobacteria bacterium]
MSGPKEQTTFAAEFKKAMRAQKKKDETRTKQQKNKEATVALGVVTATLLALGFFIGWKFVLLLVILLVSCGMLTAAFIEAKAGKLSTLGAVAAVLAVPLALLSLLSLAQYAWWFLLPVLPFIGLGALFAPSKRGD